MKKTPIGEPKYAVGDWVADPRNTLRPQFGRVCEVMWDQFDGCWAICIHLYNCNGGRGRFEPMLCEKHWARIERPDFPLPNGRHDDWGTALNYVVES